jgi:hypothetical protein
MWPTSCLQPTRPSWTFLDPSAWRWQNTLYVNQLIALLARVDGAERVVQVYTPSDDLTLGTVASLVRARTVSVTAVDS